MKKLLIALMLVCIGLLIADPIPIGNGSLVDTHLPMEPFYGYTYSQVIYTAEEIGGAVNIENVAWHYNGNSAWVEDCVVYMGHTTQDEFGDYPSWIPIEELTQVWAGGFTVMDFDHWVTVDLQTQFAYNGVDNLVIAFDANTPGYTSSMDEFYGTATDLNRSIYFYSDSTNPDPADPPTGTYREEYNEMEAAKTGKTLSRAAGVQAIIANIILNHDGVMPSGFVNGHVYDSVTLDPLEGATVSVGNFIGTTDASGFYEIEVLLEGTFTVTASHYGYFNGTDEVTVVFDQTATVDFYLDVFDTAGTSCADPYYIDSIPFYRTGMTTEGFGNDYDGTMACGSYYMNGDDFVFSFTPTENMSLDITLTNTLNYTGLFVVQGFVDDPNAVCVAMATGWAGNPMLQEVILTMGNTYYIVISTWPTPYFTPFDIAIEANEPPEFGGIEGLVYGDGAPIGGAVVTAGEYTTTTDMNGSYEMVVETGTYDVLATAPGFFNGLVSGVIVQEGVNTTVDFDLEVFNTTGDTIEDPIIVDAFPYFMSGDIEPYTDYSTIAGLEGGTSGKDVYYQLDLPNGATAELHGCGSEFDTYMNLYNDAYTRVAYDDDGCSTWPSGSSMAPWIGQDDGSYVVILSPGTYYVAMEAYSSYNVAGYFEVHFDVMDPPEFGGIEGFVTDSETGNGINGVNVAAGGVQVVTDATGWYAITGLQTGFYDVSFSATGYNPWTETGVEVLADVNVQLDVALVPLTGVVFEMTVDSWPTEATWNVWDYQTNSYVWGTDWTFTTGGETVIVSEDLPDGNYSVDCWDTFGDGGIAGVVSKQGVILAEWASNDYTTYGEFPFIVGPIAFGGLEGTVTDNFTGDPIFGASVICGNYQGTTDAAGYYSIPEVLVGTYDVLCNAPGYTGQLAIGVGILEDVVTVQDFGLDIIMNPATDLTATVDGYNVGLEWTEPFFPPTDILHWDDMINFDAIGLTDGGTFSVAARFTPAELAPFAGELLSNVTVYINDLPSAMTLYVWSGPNAANVLLQQTVTPVALDWNNFVFNTPVLIDGSTELWIGYEVTHAALEYPAGCDAGPAVAGFGDMITMDNGLTWDPLSGFGLDYNWNIWGGIAGERGENVVLARPQPWNPEPIQTDMRLELGSAGVGETVREFTGTYNVYRDDEVIATVGETMYDDLGLAAGIYEYYVTAVYDEGESPETNHVVVELGTADVTVNPTSLSEVLDYGLTSDHNITLTNNGDGNFYWNGSIQTRGSFNVGEMTPRPAEKVGAGAELSPEAQIFEVPQTRDIWDIVGTFTTTQVSQAGIEFDGTYFYTAAWNSADINKFDIDGNFIETFTIPGVTGLRDLAYDGQYFYGGAAGTNLWKMDFSSQTLVETIISPVAVRAIAYDDDNDAFWVNDWSTDVTLVSRTGNILDSFPCGTWGDFYGLAYDNITEGGPYLYGYSQGGSGCVIAQYNIETGAETGVIHDVLEDHGVPGEDIAGGAFTSADYADGLFVIGVMNQSSYIVTMYELCPTETWLSIAPHNGTLAPGASVDITATFNAIELPGLTYYANIVFGDGEVSAVVAADLEITGSIPTPDITVNPEAFDVIVAADGTADFPLTIGNDGDLELDYSAEIFYYEGRAIVEVYPQDEAYWTGSVDATDFTDNSNVRAIDVENGWMMFDVSGIPAGAIINSIECNVYVNDTNWPYWSLTPCLLDPLTTGAAALQAHIIAGNPQASAYSFNNETGTFAPGWHAYNLVGTANADLAAALSQGWFAVGASPRDMGTSYYTLIDGWNQANPPYLVVDYSIPINPWVTFDGSMAVSGLIPVGGGADAHNLHFDAAGLIDGDVMMGEIVIESNDLYNPDVVVPVTLTVGQAYLYGDVTGDEVIDAFDAANVLQYTVGMNPVGAPLPWTWELIAGDVDGNGTPEAYDAALILQYAVGMIDVFPVEARTAIPSAEVVMTSENGELVFSATGELYGFSVSTDSELLNFKETEIDYLHAVNGNAVALANAEAISGEFLRIPYELVEDSGEFVLITTCNGISTETTYNVEDLESGVIAANAVFGNYPNPFNPTTMIKLAVKDNNTPVSINIYNVKGQLVKSLVNETVASGNYSFEWSGTDNSNRSVSSGVYFYKVKIGDLNETRKMIMLK